MTGTQIVLLVGCAAALVYGLLDVLAPGVTIRWQVKTPGRGPSWRRETGRAFQRALELDPEHQPSSDPALRRRVRWIGVFLIAFGSAFGSRFPGRRPPSSLSPFAAGL